MGRHIHAELIKAWADGAIIEGVEFLFSHEAVPIHEVTEEDWETLISPNWLPWSYYRIKPKACVHAESMVLYAQDALQNEKPWLLWEAKLNLQNNWVSLKVHPGWFTNMEYRRKAQ